jgi:hypothetical protein
MNTGNLDSYGSKFSHSGHKIIEQAKAWNVMKVFDKPQPSSSPSQNIQKRTQLGQLMGADIRSRALVFLPQRNSMKPFSKPVSVFDLKPMGERSSLGVINRQY